MTHLKNYRTRKSTSPISQIHNMLIERRARQLIFEYDGAIIKALAFSLPVGNNVFSYKLPARYEKVERLLYPNKKPAELTPVQKDQAYRTAWANVRDWLTAQFALIDTEMVKMEEVFLPYMVNKDGKTYFEILEQKQFLLESG